MSLETSTLNIMLSAILALQVWLVREVFYLRTKIALLSSKLDNDDEQS